MKRGYIHPEHGRLIPIERAGSGEDFARTATEFLSAREAENNLLLGITSELVSGAAFGGMPPYLGVARRDGRIVAAAIRTPPFGVTISATDDMEAVDALAEDVARVYSAIPGVLAPIGPATRFVERWESLTPQRANVRANERIHKCSVVMRARSPRGGMRAYTGADRMLALQWTKLFIAESKLPKRASDAEIQGEIDRKLGAADGGFYFWDVDGETVSMAAAGGRTPNGIRIGPVYTPPNFRGAGYATALVADLTSLKLSSGLGFCFLFTDRANPTSNSIYTQIGYVPVIDCTMYDLV